MLCGGRYKQYFQTDPDFYGEIAYICEIHYLAQMCDDSKYLKEMANGNAKAFDHLYITYAPRTEELLFRMLKSRVEAEDITHDLFLKIWKEREYISNVKSFRDYLFRMAKNAAFDRYDHNVVKETYRLRLTKIPHFDELTDKEIDADELAAILAMAISNMPPKRQKVFRMSREDGKSNKLIAEELGLSVRTVENQIALAIRELRKLMSVIAFFL